MEGCVTSSNAFSMQTSSSPILCLQCPKNWVSASSLKALTGGLWGGHVPMNGERGSQCLVFLNSRMRWIEEADSREWDLSCSFLVCIQIKKKLKDYDALHVRRGDKLKVHKGKSGAVCTMYAYLNRDTQPQAIMERIKLWIPTGRTLYIATDEKQTHYFDQLSSK